MNRKILHISTTNKGGAGIAAKRLFLAQRKAGYEVAFLSKSITIDFSGQELEAHSLSYAKPGLGKRLLRKIKLRLGRHKSLAFSNDLQRLKEHVSAEIITSPYGRKRLNTHRLVREADMLHLHWVGGWVDYPTFFKEADKPMVWTLHDANPFMGVCHYPWDLEDNMKLIQRIEIHAGELKKQGLLHANKLAVTAPSTWLMELARNSGQFRDGTTYHTIPNSVDLSIFRPKDPGQLRREFEIGEGETVLAFVAGSLDIKRKGIGVLLEALEIVETPLTILMMGKGEIGPSPSGHRLIQCGFIGDQDRLAAIYSLADALLLPSLEDNLPNTMLESLACGTPVIAFAKGGMKEHLAHSDLGLLIEEETSRAFADGICTFVHSKQPSDSAKIRAYAEKHFSPENQIEAYRRIYESNSS